MPVRFVILAISVALLGACAPVEYRPPAEAASVAGDYDADLAQCEELASRAPPAAHAVAGALVGAIFGALLGRAAGLDRYDTTQVAAIGAVNGAANGLVHDSEQWDAAVDRCMARRGYDAPR